MRPPDFHGTVVRPLAGRIKVYFESPIAGGDSNQVFQVRPPDFHGTVVRSLLMM